MLMKKKCRRIRACSFNSSAIYKFLGITYNSALFRESRFRLSLKSFFASVEAVERGIDPLKENLVVTDESRGNGAICLAITPAMKKLGIKNRCRIFEIPENVSYIKAVPRMKLYMKYSADIYEIYLRYIAKEDIYIYSIDECFFDVTAYLKLYNKNPVEMAQMLTDAVYKETGISASVGIGTNLFLCKVALDVTAKHSENSIGELDIEKFKKTLWHHRPITDIWNVGKGIANRLERYGIYDLYGIAHADKRLLYKEFGVNAEFMIDHANGIEPCTIAEIHDYVPQNSSISTSQILFEDYNYSDAFIVLKEMVETLVLELIEKNFVVDSISLYVGYSKDVIKQTGGTVKLCGFTDSLDKINDAFFRLYKRTAHKEYPIRKLTIGLNNLSQEDCRELDVFSDCFREKQEHKRLKTLIDIKNKFGKNSVVKAISLTDKATAVERNNMVGGHRG